MTTRTTRRLWLIGLFLLLPWPLAILGDASVPAARYLLLGGVAATVAIAEGAAGPVGLVVMVLLGWGLLTLLFDWALAWAIARALALLPGRARSLITIACLLGAGAAALLLDPYRTPFGRAARGGLLEILS